MLSFKFIFLKIEILVNYELKTFLSKIKTIKQFITLEQKAHILNIIKNNELAYP